MSLNIFQKQFSVEDPTCIKKKFWKTLQNSYENISTGVQI